MKGSASAPNSATMKGSRCAMRPAMKAPRSPRVTAEADHQGAVGAGAANLKPTTPTVPAAAKNKKHNDDNDEKRGGIHPISPSECQAVINEMRPLGVES